MWTGQAQVGPVSDGNLGPFSDEINMGPVGVGKTFLAQALGSAAVRAGHSVLFSRADALLKDLAQARADHTYEKAFRRYLAPQLLIVDDFGLHRLSSQQSSDWYELIIERHRRSSFVVTANRAVDEWLALFDDPILGNSALDRLANGAHQLVIEGPSYRAKLAPKRRGQLACAPPLLPPEAHPSAAPTTQPPGSEAAME
jgi:DNA replication protein DnaC